MKFHKLSELFPMLEGNELEVLAQDIKANGLREPITTYRDEILDGRNRYAACVIAEVEPTFREYQGDDTGLLAFVISANLHRRHLSETQRADIADEVANIEKHQHKSDTEISVSQSDAAKMFNVSADLVGMAHTVKTNGIPELRAMMRQDHIAASTASKIASKTDDFQHKVVKKIKAGVKPTEAIRQVIGESYSDDKLEIGEKRFRVVYADPPWQYGNTQMDGFKEQRDHYRTMPLDEICSMPIKEMVEDNAVLFLWATSPILEESFEVISAWGFKYKASFVWDKVKHVMGHYNSVRHEFLLICTRGSCLPDIHKLIDSVQTIERGEHSVKPNEFREIIDTIYPNGNRIELFARGKTANGWDAFGNEAG